MFQYFAEVVKHKQITIAAEALHISQPALSKAIKTLETDVGFQLFERSTRKLKLTEPGEIFHNQVRVILREYNNMYKVIDDIHSIGTGTLNIGIIESFKYWIPDILKQFKQQYPEISVTIQVMGPKNIEDALKNYQIHLGVTSIVSKQNEKLLNSLPLYKDNLVLITSTNHRLSRLKHVNITELKQEKLIHSFSGYMIRNSVIEACERAGFTPTIDYETEDLETAMGLVEAGLGVSVIPESYIKPKPSINLNVIKFSDELPKRNVYIVQHISRYLSPSTDEFVTILQNTFDNNDFL